MVEWRNDEMVNSPQWGYGEMLKRNYILLLTSTNPFPLIEKRTNWFRGRLSSSISV